MTLAPLSPAADALVLEFEGLNQPGRVPDTRCPSGVTIGHGYDLAHHTAAELEADWGPFLPADQLARLSRAIGFSGEGARILARRLGDILIRPDSARKVFDFSSVPKYQRCTEQAFPGVAGYPIDAQGALFSLVYNRGSKLAGDRRQEMRAIALEVAQPWTVAALMNIAAALRAMKRLWSASDAPGLLRRREAEARLVESAIPAAAA